jgi:hypothetical protein
MRAVPAPVGLCEARAVACADWRLGVADVDGGGESLFETEAAGVGFKSEPVA